MLWAWWAGMIDIWITGIFTHARVTVLRVQFRRGCGWKHQRYAATGTLFSTDFPSSNFCCSFWCYPRLCLKYYMLRPASVAWVNPAMPGRCYSLRKLEHHRISCNCLRKTAYESQESQCINDRQIQFSSLMTCSVAICIHVPHITHHPIRTWHREFPLVQ